MRIQLILTYRNLAKSDEKIAANVIEKHATLQKEGVAEG